MSGNTAMITAIRAGCNYMDPNANICGWPDCPCETVPKTVRAAAAVLTVEHERRVAELLEANNREVERRRGVEAEIERIKSEVHKLCECEGCEGGTLYLSGHNYGACEWRGHVLGGYK